MKKKAKYILLGVLIVVAISFLGLQFVEKVIDNGVRSYYSINWVSTSIKQAKSTHVFTRNVEVSPKVLKIEEKKVEITDCWVEQRTKIIYKLFFPAERKYLGKYRLCFKINQQYNDMSNYVFRDINSKLQFFIGVGGKLGNESETYYEPIENKPQKIKVDVTKGFKETLGSFMFEVK